MPTQRPPHWYLDRGIQLSLFSFILSLTALMMSLAVLLGWWR